MSFSNPQENKRVSIKDEGITIADNPDSLDFVGAGVSGTVSGLDATMSIPGGGGALNVEVPSGTVDGSNTTFTVVNTPVYIIVDGVARRSGKGYTYSAGTITVDSLNPPVYDIFSVY